MGMFSSIIHRSVTGDVKAEDKNIWISDITPEELHDKMKKGIVLFTYIKKDGKTEREAWGTVNMDAVTEYSSIPNGGDCPPKRAGYSIYYDVEMQGWRAYLDKNLKGSWSKIFTSDEFKKEVDNIKIARAEAEKKNDDTLPTEV